MKKKIELIMSILLILSAVCLANHAAHISASQEELESQGGWISAINIFGYKDEVMGKKFLKNKKIVIDPGHGGEDLGKIAVDGALEKDINLTIALALGTYLKEHGADVHYTRQTDEGLYSSGAVSKKSEDLKKRCSIVENVNPDITISIHQNSYTESYVKGAQVFYYSQSAPSMELAKNIQKELIQTADPENHREAKANDSYYILKRTVSPTVIVECGFLSNPKEAELLQKESYQKKIVQGIYNGIVQYFQDTKEKK